MLRQGAVNTVPYTGYGVDLRLAEERGQRRMAEFLRGVSNEQATRTHVLAYALF